MQLEVYGPDRNVMANLLIEEARDVEGLSNAMARVVCLQLIDGRGYGETLQQFQQAYAESRAKWARCRQLLGMNQI